MKTLIYIEPFSRFRRVSEGVFERSEIEHYSDGTTAIAIGVYYHI